MSVNTPNLKPPFALPSPELTPSADEPAIVIGPNLAEEQDLCRDVVQYITDNYWYPYLMLQQQFWPAWREIDLAWRGRFDIGDALNTAVTNTSLKDNTVTGNTTGFAAKGQNVMFFRQVHAITDIGEQMSFEQGVPIRAEVPEEIDEDDFYRPTEQSVAAANSIFRQDAEEFSLRDNWRKSFGGYVKYGTSYSLMDFSKSIESISLRFIVSADPMQMQSQVQELQMAYPASQVQLEEGPQGMVAVCRKEEVRLRTGFQHLRIDDVFIDPLIPCDPMDRQPCPIIREHVTAMDLEQNPYDPYSNQFGYLNTELAIDEQKGHYALSEQSEGPLRAQLRTRYNISDSITGLSTEQIRVAQKWTAYPWLRISPEGKLDKGQGVECPECMGARRIQEQDQYGGISEVDCLTCRGKGTIRIPAKRYVVVFYGAPRMNTTCLRIQELPEGMGVPIGYAPDLVEDDSCAIPMSTSEIAIIAIQQVTRAECQFETAKDLTINRPFLVKDDTPSASITNFNKPGAVFKYEGDPREIMRMDGNNFDETATLPPYIQYKENTIQAIKGATDTLLGQLATGRRSAMEIGQATEAAKNPLVLLTDRFNRKMMGGWGRTLIRNLEMFGDRDYIKRKTGRPWFGKVRIVTSAGSDFIKKMAMANDIRWWLQAAPTLPQLQPVIPELANQLLKISGIQGIRIPDGGMKKAITDGMMIITRILGDGEIIMPLLDEPHEIYLQMFQQALKDDYWKKYPENIPLMQQRILQQQQLFQQQQMMAMQQAAVQAQIEGLSQPQGRGNQPPGPSDAKQTPGGQQQAAQG